MPDSSSARHRQDDGDVAADQGSAKRLLNRVRIAQIGSKQYHLSMLPFEVDLRGFGSSSGIWAVLTGLAANVLENVGWLLLSPTTVPAVHFRDGIVHPVMRELLNGCVDLLIGCMMDFPDLALHFGKFPTPNLLPLAK